ncbi:calcium permeable stress-gated cation channel [Geosmithia morbida]|uniref:Calcium permeable stress-gated cation channel n=1 Tax=Geosmithia morbida TaxID=1094350 RepID=A0A9P4Z3P8_9HYPO|nr:calcium permeable stress-gated cation channel [Geosmithia morbida]KAF4126956.1 calcium permeable stress-gated cation channel [Geosmithia morbida]
MYNPGDNDTCDSQEYIRPASKTTKDLGIQLGLSLIIGVSAFVTFCTLRPRWPFLYAARKRRLEPKIVLPALSNTFLGWIPRLYRISEQDVLTTAGLDAFVFLNFFKMAIRLFAIMAFFATLILLPINNKYRNFRLSFGGNGTSGNSTEEIDLFGMHPTHLPLDDDVLGGGGGHDDKDHSRDRPYLWAYVIFTYFFVALTLYFINWETFRIIRLRQKYLGLQSTVTDRTFRLTGIPSEMRSEDEIKQLIESLHIGHVKKVMLCRDWREIDDLMEQRDRTLRQLEKSWSRLLRAQASAKPAEANHHSHGDGTAADDGTDAVDGGPGPDENGQLLGHGSEPSHVAEAKRPKVTIYYGLLKLRSKKVDAIDYYEEKLRRLDEKVVVARGREYRSTDMALVTMDSVASCQMLIQARIDPRPGRLLTKPTPAPADLVWKNMYALRGIRRLKSWAITIFITFLTLLWIFPTAFIASWLSICTVKKVAPSLWGWLNSHTLIYSLLRNGVPTLVVSLLNVAVPYLYDWLSNRQGMISQGDVELSVISKNFFFTFFNTFFVFAVSRTGFDFWSTLQELLKDTSKIPAAIFSDVEELSIFYISFIMLQGIGLMPFRILEVGSVFLYPFSRLMSATPRDFSELREPPAFQYGFFLPTALLVFNLCLIYSILRMGFLMLIFGTIYFALGYFTFKYMLLYAMGQPQHATGGAWRIICYRILVGLVVFEVVMVGQIASLKGFVQSVSILPLIPFTVWYSYYYNQRFEPLTKYIALRAIQPNENEDEDAYGGLLGGSAILDGEPFDDESGIRPSQVVFRRGSTLDEFKEHGLTFVNPSLVVPLQRPWIYRDQPPPVPDDDSETTEGQQPSLIVPDSDASLGIGEDNVWRDSGNNAA